MNTLDAWKKWDKKRYLNLNRLCYGHQNDRDEIYAADRNKEEQWVARVCLYKFTPFSFGG